MTHEQEPSIELPRKYYSSAELICNPIAEGEQGFDKIFITGQIKQSKEEVIVSIASDMPTAVLNTRYKEQLRLAGIPTVGELRSNSMPPLSLVSGGAFLWLYQAGMPKLVLIRRDEQAPTEKEYLTSPAGRCSEKLPLTCLQELNEELIIVKKDLDNGRVSHRVIVFAYETSSRKEIEDIKNKRKRDLDAIKAFLTELLVFWQSVSPGKEKEDAVNQLHNEINMINQIEEIDVVISERNTAGRDIITEIDGHEIDRFRGFGLMDEINNTLEVRTIGSIPSEYEIEVIYDGDTNFHEKIINFDPSFSTHRRGGREILIASPEMLNNEKLAPALAAYVESLKG